MSPVVNPRAYNDNTISSMLDSRRCRFATITGSKLPSRSRGTSTATSPEPVNTALARLPLRELPGSAPTGSCLMPLWMSSGLEQRIELSGDVALEAPQRFSFGLPLSDSALNIGRSARVPTHPGQRDAVDGRVSSPVPAPAEPAPAGVPRGCLDRADAAQRRKRCLGPQTVRVVTGSDQ